MTALPVVVGAHCRRNDDPSMTGVVIGMNSLDIIVRYQPARDWDRDHAFPRHLFALQWEIYEP